MKIPKIMKRGGYHNQSALDHLKVAKDNPQNENNKQE